MMENNKQRKGLSRLKHSFKYATDGIKYAYKNEQTVWLYIPVAIIVVILGFLLKISMFEWLVIILILGIILTLELINTAIEATVDLVTQEYHPLARTAKDVVSAAVFVFAITSIICGLIIFVPKIVALF